MPKYYIDSGTLRFVCEAPTNVEALDKAMAQCLPGTALGKIIRVNEQGFAMDHDDDVYFDTITSMNRSNVV